MSDLKSAGKRLVCLNLKKTLSKKTMRNSRFVFFKIN